MVIGAGLAGIACARRLAAAGLTVTVIDKGRGIGGRMATRRVSTAAGEVRFDHGAQYLTARDPGFAAAMEALTAQGAAARWEDGAAEAHHTGLPGMSGLVRALAEGLPERLAVRQGVEATVLTPEASGWRVDTASGPLSAARVVSTVPAPQAARLIGPAHPLAAALEGVRMAPCLTLMAAFPEGSPRPFRTARSSDHPLAWIAEDSSKPGRPRGAVTWVAQAGPAWSTAHLEAERETIAARMLPLLAERIAVDPGAALHAAAQRWRYASVAVPLGRPFLRHEGLWLGGDWCLAARAEAAWLSGTAIAEDLLAAG